MWSKLYTNKRLALLGDGFAPVGCTGDKYSLLRYVGIEKHQVVFEVNFTTKKVYSTAPDIEYNRAYPYSTRNRVTEMDIDDNWEADTFYVNIAEFMRKVVEPLC